MFEIDHLFVWVDSHGTAADQLVQFGLCEGQPNVHPGQGTACRRFFFGNAYLELLWVCDTKEAQSELAIPTGLWSRSQRQPARASPFGLSLRPADHDTGPPFPAWAYRPPYLPDGLAIHVGSDVPETEPFWFYLGFGKRPDNPVLRKRQPLDHATGFRHLTGVRFFGPHLDRPSEVARLVARTDGVTLAVSPNPFAEITFDGGSCSLTKDFRPQLPFVFRW